MGVLNYALRVSQKLVVSRDFRFQVRCICLMVILFRAVSLPGCAPVRGSSMAEHVPAILRSLHADVLEGEKCTELE